MRPIDADDLVKKIYEHAWVADNIFIDELVDGIIGNMETIEERSRGHWIIPRGDVKPFGDDTIQCDMCGFFTDVDCNYNFCPNCGAKMVEPQESEDKE